MTTLLSPSPKILHGRVPYMPSDATAYHFAISSRIYTAHSSIVPCSRTSTGVRSGARGSCTAASPPCTYSARTSRRTSAPTAVPNGSRSRTSHPETTAGSCTRKAIQTKRQISWSWFCTSLLCYMVARNFASPVKSAKVFADLRFYKFRVDSELDMGACSAVFTLYYIVMFI